MVIDNLRLIDGYFDNERFILRGIIGYAIIGCYKVDGLLSFSRLIQENEPISLIIDKDLVIPIPVELNAQLKEELEMIATYLIKQKSEKK